MAKTIFDLVKVWLLDLFHLTVQMGIQNIRSIQKISVNIV